MNLIDRIVWAVSPSTALRRMQARMASDMLESSRRYNAATKGRRGANWNAKSTSAQTEISLDLITLRNRSRDMVRNNPFAAKAVQVIQNNVIGTGIRPSISNARAKNAWKAWAETTDCDWNGQMNFYGLQKQIMRTVAESGECIVVKRRLANTRSGVPIRLQVLEGDYIEHSRTYDVDGGGYIQNGIEYSGQGERVAYWLYERHPGDQRGPSFVGRRVPASDVLHVYDVQRPGQVRGVPFGVSALLRLQDFDEYEDAQLVRQKIAACFSVFITDSSEALGGIDSAAREEAGRVEPGIIEYLPPGKQVSFASPPGAEGYTDYSRKILQGVSAAYGITYEALTNDLSAVNFSSARMGWLEMQRNIEDWQQRMIIPMLCQPVFDWFVAAATIAGRGGAAINASWTTPRREMVDPTREVPAVITAIRGGLITQSEALRQAGYEPDDVYSEIAADNKAFDRLGLILDSDPRKVMKAGITQPYLDTASSAAGFDDPPPPAPTAPPV